jgi:hypothetical protein
MDRRLEVQIRSHTSDGGSVLFVMGKYSVGGQIEVEWRCTDPDGKPRLDARIEMQDLIKARQDSGGVSMTGTVTIQENGEEYDVIGVVADALLERGVAYPCDGDADHAASRLWHLFNDATWNDVERIEVEVSRDHMPCVACGVVKGIHDEAFRAGAIYKHDWTGP